MSQLKIQLCGPPYKQTCYALTYDLTMKDNINVKINNEYVEHVWKQVKMKIYYWLLYDVVLEERAFKHLLNHIVIQEALISFAITQITSIKSLRNLCIVVIFGGFMYCCVLIHVVR